MSHLENKDSLDSMIGKTFKQIDIKVGRVDFTCTDGSEYEMFHSQDCCESVDLEEVIGDISDILGNPILLAEEVTSNENPKKWNHDYIDDSFTWTFYKFSTIKGSVTLRWYGSSNGYYSEDVTVKKVS